MEQENKPRERVQFEDDLRLTGMGVSYKRDKPVWFVTFTTAGLWLSYSSGQSTDAYTIGFNTGQYEIELKRYVKEGVIRQFDRNTLGEMEAGDFKEKALFRCSDFETLVNEKYPAMGLLDKHLFMSLMEVNKDELEEVDKQKNKESITKESPAEKVMKEFALKPIKGFKHDSDVEVGRRQEQIDALCKTLVKMGYKCNKEGSIVVDVGKGEVRGIHAECLEDHGGHLFPQLPESGKKSNTFNGIWKDAKSDKYGKRIVVINKRGVRRG